MTTTSNNTTDQPPFPFLSLPETVRQRFYEIRLQAPRNFIRLFSKTCPTGGTVKAARVKINILFTCRQIYQEAMPVLYRINTFCILPITSSPVQQAQDEQQLFTLQNDRWIYNMPIRGRNMIRSLEIQLPLPPSQITGDFIYKEMNSLFPALHSLVLFFDPSTQSTAWVNLPDPTAYLSFYQQLQKTTPRARQISLDQRIFDTMTSKHDDETLGWQPFLNHISKVCNAATDGKSNYTTQDLSHAHKFNTQIYSLRQKLHQQLGARAANWQGLLYYDIRRNKINQQAHSRDEAGNRVFQDQDYDHYYPDDDDTDDENECFGKFDLEKVVQKKVKNIKLLEQGNYVDFEDEVSAFW
jgi:hypothetical protein